MQTSYDSYEIGFAAEVGWQGGDEADKAIEAPPPFDYVAYLLDRRIEAICASVDATEPPILYLTGKGNFRENIAKKRPYKERPSHKPWHFNNLTAYIKGKYEYRESTGMEADDLMAIEQTVRPNETIICTRDKDLRQVAGWHFGWELGNQPQFGPELVDELGKLELDEQSTPKKIKGTGYLFFLSQILTGDPVDTIPGLPKCGAVGASKILAGVKTKEEGLEAVREAYKGFYGDNYEPELLEQGRLVWMTRELKEGEPVLWNFTY